MSATDSRAERTAPHDAVLQASDGSTQPAQAAHTRDRTRAFAGAGLLGPVGGLLKRLTARLRYARGVPARLLLGRGPNAEKARSAIFGPGHFVRLQFPPSTRSEPRYGHGRPAHRSLSEILARHDGDYRETLHRFTSYRADLEAIPLDQTSPLEPHWRNGLLFGLDGVSLYAFTRMRTPRRYVEIGSGNSTLFVDRARRDGGLEMELRSIDPSPRREIDSICDKVLREPLESSDLEALGDLDAGDIVFLDGTHRVFMNSDVTVFFLDVLPALPPGILVGIHDIHLPDDYRPEHADRYYSEQYLLASYLLGESPWVQPVLPCWYVSHHATLGQDARATIPQAVNHTAPVQPRAPAQRDPHGTIFWLQTGSRPHAASGPT